MGAIESLASLSLAFALPLGGALVALSSTRIAFLILGVGATGTAIAFVRLTLTGLRGHVEDGLQAQPAVGD
jgi:hypothetical protein